MFCQATPSRRSCPSTCLAGDVVKRAGLDRSRGAARVAIVLCVLMVAPGIAGAGGWYLLTPRPGGTAAPLSEWQHVSSHDNARDCEATKRQVVERAAGELHELRRSLREEPEPRPAPTDRRRAGRVQVPDIPAPGGDSVTNEPTYRATRETLREAEASRCIATEDPRLR
jgi:hypothetical protein